MSIKAEKEMQKAKYINPTPVGGGRFPPPPYRKMAITTKNNDPNELKLRDFSYISMTNPPIPFLGLKMVKKGVSRAFLLSAVLISGSENSVFQPFLRLK